jgi:hypothetical protein
MSPATLEMWMAGAHVAWAVVGWHNLVTDDPEQAYDASVQFPHAMVRGFGHKVDGEPAQVGHVEESLQEAAMWLERTMRACSETVLERERAQREEGKEGQEEKDEEGYVPGGPNISRYTSHLRAPFSSCCCWCCRKYHRVCLLTS